MTRVDILLKDDGSLTLSVAEGEFAEAEAALKKLRALAARAGLPIVFEGDVEQHRHEKAPELEVRS